VVVFEVYFVYFEGDAAWIVLFVFDQYMFAIEYFNGVFGDVCVKHTNS